MHTPQGLAVDEPLQGFDPQGELLDRQYPLDPQAAMAKAVQVLRLGVFGAVDDPQVLAPAALDSWLSQPPQPVSSSHHCVPAATSSGLVTSITLYGRSGSVVAANGVLAE